MNSMSERVQSWREQRQNRMDSTPLPKNFLHVKATTWNHCKICLQKLRQEAVSQEAPNPPMTSKQGFKRQQHLKLHRKFHLQVSRVASLRLLCHKGDPLKKSVQAFSQQLVASYHQLLKLRSPENR